MRTPNANWRSIWEAIKLDARTQCLAETKRARFKLDQQLTLKKLVLANLRTRTTNGEQINEAEADRLEKEIKAERRKAVTLHDTLEGEAYNNGKRHDVGSSEFFRQWNPARPNQAPHKMQEADWTDLSNPTHTGSTVSSTSQILKEFTKYYTSLFADKNTDPLSNATQTCLHTLSNPSPDGNTHRVLKPTADICDAPILAKEIADAINALPTGKSPGPDRLPCRFYKTFSETIALILHKVYEESIANNELHDTCLEGLISVLYKKGVKDDPRNYYIKRRFTSKKLKTPPEEARKRFAALVTINELDYRFKLTATFQKALDDQETAATLYYAHPPTPGNHPPAH